MAPRGQKRAAPEGKKATVAKKTRSEDAQLAGILKAIQDAGQLPQTCRDMLCEGLRGSLNVMSGDRHATQKMMVGFAEETINVRESSLQQQLSDARTVKAKAIEEHSSKQATLAEAEASLIANTALIQETASAHAAAAEKLAAAKLALSVAKTACNDANASLLTLQEDKTRVNTAVEGDVKATAQGEAVCNELVSLCQRFAFDESLTLALPGTCARPQAERGSFDNMVLDQLETSLKGKLDELTASLESHGKTVEEKSSDVERAKAIVQDVDGEVADAVGKHAAAESARTELTSSIENSKAALVLQDSAVAEAENLCVSKLAGLEEFMTAVANVFCQMRDATAPSFPEHVDVVPKDADAVAPTADAVAPTAEDTERAEAVKAEAEIVCAEKAPMEVDNSVAAEAAAISVGGA